MHSRKKIKRTLFNLENNMNNEGFLSNGGGNEKKREREEIIY